MISYVIVDDEPIAHRIIEGYCAELPHLKKVGNAYHVFEASKIVAQHNVDLIFLDINMPKMTGFEWLKTISGPLKIIVTSAHKEYALEGYELNVLDYLLKPFSFARFIQAVNKFNAPKKDIVSGFPSTQASENGSFFLKGDKQYHQIHKASILFVEAMGNYCRVVLEDEIIVSHEKISTLEDILPSADFLRVHKSFLVARHKIKRVEGNRIHLEHHKIPIGQTYKGGIRNLLDGTW